MASTTWQAVGNKADICDVITNISPDETRLINKFGRGTATAMAHDWLTDVLRPAQENKKLEKADFVTAEATPRKRMGNYIQHFMVGYQVTDAQEAVLKHGVKSEIAYQMLKATKELSRDFEFATLKNKKKVRGDSSTEGMFGGVRYFTGGDARQFAVDTTNGVVTLVEHGFTNADMVSVYATDKGVMPKGLNHNGMYFIHRIDADKFTLHATTIDAYANTNAIVPSTAGTAPFYVTSSNIVSANGALTETMFNDLMHKTWKQGANVDSAVMSGMRKREVSSWTAGTTKNRTQDDRKLITIIDVYESDMGLVNLEAHRMQDDDRIDFFEYQYWKLCYLKPFHVEDVARKGTYTEKVITGMVTLENRSPISNGAIINIQ